MPCKWSIYQESQVKKIVAMSETLFEDFLSKYDSICIDLYILL